MRGYAALFATALALGCQNGAPPAAPPVVTEHRDAAAFRSLAEVTYHLREARVERIHRLQTCSLEDWRTLVLMAVGRYDWGDDLEFIRLRAARETQLVAILALLGNGSVYYSGPESRGLRRRVAVELSRPEILSALEDAISGKIVVEPWAERDDFASVVEFAPLHQLRPAIAAHVSDRHRDELLAELDRDLDYHPGPRVEQLERWASELTPSGFERVFEALAPGYAWSDGGRPPTAAEQREIDERAVDLIFWLSKLAMLRRSYACPISDAVAHGRLGALLLARLDHPNIEVRRALLALLARCRVAGGRARVAELEATDPDPSIRKLAADARARIDRGEVDRDAHVFYPIP